MASDDAKITNGDNFIGNNSPPAEIAVKTETFDYTREPPPPYTVSDEVDPIDQSPQAVIQQDVVIHQPGEQQQPQKDHPVISICGVCGETVMTKVQHVNTRKTHMCAGFICGCTLWCMMCCLGAIPYILPICKKAKHYCPNCDNPIGDNY